MTGETIGNVVCNYWGGSEKWAGDAKNHHTPTVCMFWRSSCLSLHTDIRSRKRRSMSQVQFLSDLFQPAVILQLVHKHAITHTSHVLHMLVSHIVFTAGCVAARGQRSSIGLKSTCVYLTTPEPALNKLYKSLIYTKLHNTKFIVEYLSKLIWSSLKWTFRSFKISFTSFDQSRPWFPHI